MKIEVDVVRHFDGRVGHIKNWLSGYSIVEFHDGEKIVREFWDNDYFIVVHTITIEQVDI